MNMCWLVQRWHNSDEAFGHCHSASETAVEIEEASTRASSLQMTGMDMNVLYFFGISVFLGCSVDDLVLIHIVSNLTQLRELNPTGELMHEIEN